MYNIDSREWDLSTTFDPSNDPERSRRRKPSIRRVFFYMKMSQELLESLSQDLSEDCVICPNSTRDRKRIAMLTFAENASRHGKVGSDEDLTDNFVYYEPKLLSALSTAVHKARSIKVNSPCNYTGAGADGTFFFFDGRENRWVQLHQLGRDGHSLSQEKIITEYRFLKKNLVSPRTENGRVYVAWGHGLAYINGNTHGYEDMILVRSAPMELDYFQKQFADSVENKEILHINARMKMFEILSGANLIEKIGFIPGKILERNESVLPYIVDTNAGLEEIGKLEVLTTMPWSLLGFDFAQENARRIPL